MSQSIPEFDEFNAQTGFDDAWQDQEEFADAPGEDELEIEEDRARER